MPITPYDNTIFALSSAGGRAGVAVVRLSGATAIETAVRLAGRSLPPRLAVLCHIRDLQHREIDRALAIAFPAPRSFTGENAAELHVHGSAAVLSHLFATLADCGLVPAAPGEFTRRAVLNGKMSLAEAEALLDLINAEASTQKDYALARLGTGAGRAWLRWQQALVEELARREAALDFSEDAASQIVPHTGASALDTMAAEMEAALACDLRPLADGYRVAIVGRPNVGKSSLINALTRDETSIVSGEAGTTRDIVSMKIQLRGLPVLLSDTAGIHDGAAGVEQQGIEKARDAAARADLILSLTDAAGDYLPLAGVNVIKIRNKCDLPASGTPDNDARISCATGEGLEALADIVASRLARTLPPRESEALVNQRQRGHLAEAARLVRAAQAADCEDEIASENLRAALAQVNMLTGQDCSEAVFDAVFSQFCIGK
ncbi:tRNA modification GTPase MnmE [Alphaproteobacteria bacterium]|nr:tRNA modification GTPase MnmE [Alphaproteobacteria bacterium]